MLGRTNKGNQRNSGLFNFPRFLNYSIWVVKHTMKRQEMQFISNPLTAARIEAAHEWKRSTLLLADSFTLLG